VPLSSPSPAPSVLVADDTAVALSVVARRLQALGIGCLEASSAQEASAVDPFAISCALLDLDLGDGSGVDVALALRGRRPELPIAFFSAGAAPEELERARALAHVFHKPGDLDQAVAWVQAQAIP